MLHPIKTFFCYAPEDEALVNKLKAHLRPLQQQGLIDVWHDRDIPAGAERELEIGKQLDAAQIILLLVSPDFMNTDYCSDKEMKLITERHERGEARVIPVILRPVYWQGGALFGKLQALPTGGVPVTGRKWHNIDEALVSVVNGIRAVREELLTGSKFTDTLPTSSQSLTRKGANKSQGIKNWKYPASQSEVGQANSDVAAKSSNPDSATSVSTNVTKKHAWLYKLIYYLSKHWRVYLAVHLPGVASTLFLMMLGLNALPPSVPLLQVISQHPLGPPTIGAILFVVNLLATAISFTPRPPDHPNSRAANIKDPLLVWKIATATSVSCFALSVSLLILIIVRPPWCPLQLCSVAVNDPNAVRDENLELAFRVLHDPAFMIPGDPAYYSQSTLPESTDAVRIDRNTTADIYQVVLGVHNLQLSHYKMFIEKVDIVVDQVHPVPSPLNIWAKGSTSNYTTNTYLAVYNGERPGEKFPATYLTVPHDHVSLTAGEIDTLTVQISSQVPASLHFHLQVTYQYANETDSHILTLPREFDIVFSDANNWHPYQLRNDIFVPSPSSP